MSRVHFEMGRLVATPGALAELEKHGHTVIEFLARHAKGDWSDLSEEDRKENEFSLQNGLRLLSSYGLNGDGKKIWVITEADRSSTTVLLPEEY